MLASAPVWAGPAILIAFGLAYLLVFTEEKFHVRKSKPVMIAAAFIWIFVALAYRVQGREHEVAQKLNIVLLEYADLLLFLLSAMSFVNSMVERNVFEALRSRLLAARISTRALFWITGAIAFFLSPIADNLTTSLVMGTVVMSTLATDRKALAAALVNIVIAANAGGAFSPFGDITTLMIWQKGAVEFHEFFKIFLPSLTAWLVPAAIISCTLKNSMSYTEKHIINFHKGGSAVVVLFLLTIATTIFLDRALDLPTFLGMMMGLGALSLYGHFLYGADMRILAGAPDNPNGLKPFNIFSIMEKVEWDTLLFFYGVMLCIGGIGAIGYLGDLSSFLYVGLGASVANILIGAFSSVVDNIPLTFAVLTMAPQMDHGQWLLLTLMVGVGGSLLSIGSAAGVALMGVGRGSYTFMSHLKWTWAILLGVAASIGVHFFVNRDAFSGPLF
ncbi:MAG: sodium:proton antiporter NhaD [Alphaproteobacteria bacterium]|nr:sodium:proton antiporter NhaD [Alphaproteobacteria bacterium]